MNKPGQNPNIHKSTQDTRERAYERLRKTGISREISREIAERATRESHNKLERK